MDLAVRKVSLLSLYIAILLIRAYFNSRRKKLAFSRRVDFSRQKLIVYLIQAGAVIPLVLWLCTSILDFADLAVPRLVWSTGLVIYISGVFLLFWTHRTLGVHFSDTIEFRANHTLIKKGPYFLIRHPMYSSVLLTVAGAFLLTGNWCFLAIQMSVYMVIIYVRIPVEEDAMRGQFGAAYDDYVLGTKKIIPWIY
jgi:protein-S-isoprenylcysteine O-methyltransferase Ste14